MHSRNEFNCIYNHIEHAYRYGCHVTREVQTCYASSQQVNNIKLLWEKPPGRLNFVKVTYERIEVHFSRASYTYMYRFLKHTSIILTSKGENEPSK